MKMTVKDKIKSGPKTMPLPLHIYTQTANYT
jgi:hypothetical protein